MLAAAHATINNSITIVHYLASSCGKAMTFYARISGSKKGSVRVAWGCVAPRCLLWRTGWEGCWGSCGRGLRLPGLRETSARRRDGLAGHYVG